MAKKILLKTSVVLLIFFFITACSNKEKTENIQLKQLSSKELKEKIAKQEEDFTLIDVRNIKEFKKENIEGSVCIPLDSLANLINNQHFWEEQYMYPPEDSTQIIVYASDSPRGIKAAKVLSKLGFKNVSFLKGGYDHYNVTRDKLF